MDVIERLRQERASLVKRLDEIEILLGDYQQWEARAAAFVGCMPLSGALDTVSKADAVTGVVQGGEASSMEDFETAVREILGTSPTPLDRGRLLDELRQLGIRVGGTDERNTLSARMSRLPYAVNIKGMGYTLKSRADEFNPEGGAKAADDRAPESANLLGPTAP